MEESGNGGSGVHFVSFLLKGGSQAVIHSVHAVAAAAAHARDGVEVAVVVVVVVVVVVAVHKRTF